MMTCHAYLGTQVTRPTIGLKPYLRSCAAREAEAVRLLIYGAERHSNRSQNFLVVERF